MKRTAVGIATALMAAAVWTACVGDDPTTSSGQGAQGQPCFANGTCLAPLTCQVNVCGAADGGASTSSSSSSGTSGSSSSSSGTSGQSSTTDCGDIGDSPFPTCPNGSVDQTCKQGDYCCPGKGCGAKEACTFPFQCFSNTQCGGSQKCCFGATHADAKGLGVGCVDTVLQSDTTDTGSNSVCQSSCDGSQFELCSLTGDNSCANQKVCLQWGIVFPGAPNGGQYVKTVGVCVDP